MPCSVKNSNSTIAPFAGPALVRKASIVFTPPGRLETSQRVLGIAVSAVDGAYLKSGS